jgi:soluble lytic murein transglycosylase-like protein
MFYICSHPTRQEKECAMTGKMFAAVLIGTALCTGMPVAADEAGNVDLQAAVSETRVTNEGYRIEESQGGFALVTHGVWRARVQEALPIDVARSLGPTRLANAQLRPVARAKRTSFRRAAYLPHVYQIESRHGLPYGLLDALIWTESRYNPLAVSPAGAAGLGQLMPGTAKELGVANRFDPVSNISGAARYLRQMLDRFGMVHLALAAYNAGPGAVERAGGIPRNGETPAYVSNVLAFWGFR